MTRKEAFRYLSELGFLTDQFGEFNMDEAEDDEIIRIGSAFAMIGKAFQSRGKERKSMRNLNRFLESQDSDKRFDVTPA